MSVKKLKKIKKFSIKKYRDITVTLFLALLFGISIYGRPVPHDSEFEKSVGVFVIRPYPYGLYITQRGSSIFYNISPYNIFFTNNAGEKEYLLNWDENAVSTESKIKNWGIIPRLTSALSQYNLINPSATFKTVSLKSSTKGNVVKFTLDTKDRPLDNPLVITLSFNKKDVLFDEKGTVFSINRKEIINDFENYYGLNLDTNIIENDYIRITGQKYLYILNPTTTGIIRIDTQAINISEIYVNRNTNQIEFLTRGGKTPEINLYLFSSLHRAL